MLSHPLQNLFKGGIFKNWTDWLKKRLTTIFANSNTDLSRFWQFWGLKNISSCQKRAQEPKWLIWASFERFVALCYTRLVFFVVKSCEKHIFDHSQCQIWSFDPQIIDFDFKKYQIDPKWLIWADFERFLVLLYTTLVFLMVKSCKESEFDH